MKTTSTRTCDCYIYMFYFVLNGITMTMTMTMTKFILKFKTSLRYIRDTSMYKYNNNYSKNK